MVVFLVFSIFFLLYLYRRKFLFLYAFLFFVIFSLVLFYLAFYVFDSFFVVLHSDFLYFMLMNKFSSFVFSFFGIGNDLTQRFFFSSFVFFFFLFFFFFFYATPWLLCFFISFFSTFFFKALFNFFFSFSLLYADFLFSVYRSITEDKKFELACSIGKKYNIHLDDAYYSDFVYPEIQSLRLEESVVAVLEKLFAELSDTCLTPDVFLHLFINSYLQPFAFLFGWWTIHRIHRWWQPVSDEFWPYFLNLQFLPSLKPLSIFPSSPAVIQSPSLLEDGLSSFQEGVIVRQRPLGPPPHLADNLLNVPRFPRANIFFRDRWVSIEVYDSSSGVVYHPLFPSGSEGLILFQDSDDSDIYLSDSSTSDSIV